MNTDEKNPLLLEIKKRCNAASIKIEVEQQAVIINLPSSEKEIKKIRAPISGNRAKFTELLLQFPFEKFRCINDYRAIWSSELEMIEARLESVVPVPYSYTLSRFKTEKISELDSQNRIIATSDSDRYQGIRISIGLSTKLFRIIDLFHEYVARGDKVFIYHSDEEAISKVITLVIEGIKPQNHSQAFRILENIANALLFQIDSFGVSLYLAPELEDRKRLRTSRIRREKSTLSFPEYQYDAKPMSLYWYASAATEMPLLQYLAYYQVIEFFFPTYSAQEANNIIKKDAKRSFV